MSDCTLACRICGSVYDLPAGENHRPCPACGTENCRPQMEADVGDTLRRATAQRLRCDFKHAEDSYQYILKTSPDEHEALWGLVQCRYAIEYVKDPRSGKSMPIVHAVQKRPMLTDPDFREACDLAPEAIRAQYRQEAEYIDGAMARIRELAATGDAYDVFLCHKTSRTDGVEGYTEDYNRAVQLYIMLREMGYKVFFAPFAGLTPGDNYEAGIYHALCTSKVMLVVCSNQEYINSPWVRTEWQRFLEMSYEPGADKHLIPLLYGDLSPRRLPDDFRQLQAITMGELNAKDTLVAAIRKHTGEKATARQAVEPKPAHREETKPVEPPKPAPKEEPKPAYAPESHFTTEEAEGGVAITGYTGPGGEVLIPPMIGGKKVVEIGKNAFDELEQLTKVVIPAGVTSIGVCAFYRCSSLTSVSIPESVTSIGNSAFDGCSGLTSVSIPEGVTSIGYWAFYGCSGLASVSIPESVTSIGNSVFDGCSGLTSVSIPESVTSIGDEAFYGCSSLTSVSIPESVTSIGNSAFDGCSSLTSVNIPESVTSIGDWAFYRCSSLTSVSIPESVTGIRNGAFSDCSSLTSVSIPDSVTSIGDCAFSGCSSLTSVSIPESVTNLGSNPFAKCQALTSIAVAAVNEKYYVRDGVLMSRDNLLVCYPASLTAGIYTIPAGVTGIGYSAFSGCSSLTSVSIPESVTSIGDKAFGGCSSLTNVSIPESVTSIGNSAFFACSSLTSVSIPESVTSIGDWAFQGCSNLTLRIHTNTPAHTYAQQNNLRYEVIITYAPESHFTTEVTDGGVAITGYTGPGGKVLIPPMIGGKRVVEIGVEAFNGQEQLTKVVIPESVTIISEGAFCGCSSLTSVRIPESVTDLGDNPFSCCQALTAIAVAAGNKEIYVRNGVLMSRDNSLVCYPAGLTAGSYTIPAGVTSVRSSAFRGCSSLTSVNIPAGVTSIGWSAFKDCSNLKSVSIPASVTRIGQGAFVECPSLTLRIHPNTPAHTYAKRNNLRFELTELSWKPSRKTSLLSRLFGKK